MELDIVPGPRAWVPLLVRPGRVRRLRRHGGRLGGGRRPDRAARALRRHRGRVPCCRPIRGAAGFLLRHGAQIPRRDRLAGAPDRRPARLGSRRLGRHARTEPVAARRLDPSELEPSHATRARLDEIIERWLAARPMATMGFLVQVHPYTFPEERRSFVAERDGRVVGFLGIVPIYARGGWFFEDFLTDPRAPNGTTETLID